MRLRWRRGQRQWASSPCMATDVAGAGVLAGAPIPASARLLRPFYTPYTSWCRQKQEAPAGPLTCSRADVFYRVKMARHAPMRVLVPAGESWRCRAAATAPRRPGIRAGSAWCVAGVFGCARHGQPSSPHLAPQLPRRRCTASRRRRSRHPGRPPACGRPLPILPTVPGPPRGHPPLRGALTMLPAHQRQPGLARRCRRSHCRPWYPAPASRYRRASRHPQVRCCPAPGR